LAQSSADCEEHRLAVAGVPPWVHTLEHRSPEPVLTGDRSMRKGLAIVACLIAGFVWMVIPPERSSGGKSQSEWIAALGDPAPANRAAAVAALGEIGREEYLHMAPARHSLLIIFDKCGWRTQALMIPPMVERLGDEDEAVRTAAIASLVKVGEYALW